uniref:CSN12-like protein n=2 Tax=Mesocestoides corti TaxID=53468 RepID=A0A5K3EQ90_MESCO
MAFQSVQSYLVEAHRLLSICNGKELATYLQCTDKHALNSRLALAEPETVVGSVFEAPWDEIFSAHLRCLWAIASNNFEEACACQLVLVKALTKVFSEVKEENWMLPVVIVVAVDLRRFAYALDISNKRKDESNSTYGSHLERIAQAIMKLFQICAADSRTAIEDSKKRGMMGLANQLFKIYFQINKLNLCKPIIRAIENMNMDAYFSLAQRITFNYYVGRKAMFDGDFKMANTCLTFAFERCLASHHTNKRLILIYLIPVRMLLGIFPRNSLLQKYKLQELEGIANAARTGNVQKLGEELQRYEGFFISCGIYLILEKLKMLTYRNLFKKVAGLLKTHLQPIPAFTDILKVMGVEDIDTDETECILANLIYEGKIKGYLAHQQQKLVVSKVQAFPPL